MGNQNGMNLDPDGREAASMIGSLKLTYLSSLIKYKLIIGSISNLIGLFFSVSKNIVILSLYGLFI